MAMVVSFFDEEQQHEVPTFGEDDNDSDGGLNLNDIDFANVVEQKGVVVSTPTSVASSAACVVIPGALPVEEVVVEEAALAPPLSPSATIDSVPSATTNVGAVDETELAPPLSPTSTPDVVPSASTSVYDATPIEETELAPPPLQQQARAAAAHPMFCVCGAVAGRTAAGDALECSAGCENPQLTTMGLELTARARWIIKPPSPSSVDLSSAPNDDRVPEIVEVDGCAEVASAAAAEK